MAPFVLGCCISEDKQKPDLIIRSLALLFYILVKYVTIGVKER